MVTDFYDTFDPDSYAPVRPHCSHCGCALTKENVFRIDWTPDAPEMYKVHELVCIDCVIKGET